MEAMVFAAGIGSRLKPFTLTRPKALAPVAGVPALQRCIERLRDEGGISHMVVNIHHFPDEIRRFIASDSSLSAIVDLSDESGLLLDTGGGLLNAANMFNQPDGPILLHNADVVTDFDIAEMEKHFNDSGADVLLLVNPCRSSSRMLWFDETDSKLKGWSNEKTGDVKPESFRKEDSSVFKAAFNGVHIVNLGRIAPMLRRYADSHGPVFSLTPFYLWAIGEGADIRGFVPEKEYRWHDIGTPEKLAAATADFSGTK